MARGQSPLVGYNTNVRHKGKLYHIQTEDSGVQHPHIITHLFADGGRIVASKKTSYAQHVGVENLHEIVKKLMQEQHKSMFIALRDCVYDEDAPAAPTTEAQPQEASADPDAEATTVPAELDLEALDRAAEAYLADSPAAKAKRNAQRGAGRYQQSVPIKPKSAPPRLDTQKPDPQASIFNGQVLRGKSLDEVILSYLSDDSGEER